MNKEMMINRHAMHKRGKHKRRAKVLISNTWIQATYDRGESVSASLLQDHL